jgi:NAD(P)-dependent dehydrogenase (short-subunit alcohol dehydrogenase family)
LAGLYLVARYYYLQNILKAFMDIIMTLMNTTSSNSDFGAKSTAEDVINGIDLTGKIALVTGASAGLGAETARVLSHAGAQVIMAGRDLEKIQRVLNTIAEQNVDADLIAVEVDLADLDSVRSCAAQMLEQFSCIDLLINNAGVMACPLSHTVQGHELQFGTNHLGHFLFTGLTLPLLKAAPSARVINLSSAGHKFAPVNFDDINFERREYDKWIAYGQAKTANALFSVELNRRFQAENIRSNAVHPGAIVTELGRHLSEDDIKALMADSAGQVQMIYKSIPQGAATSVWAATHPSLETVGGSYFEDCHIAELATDQVMGGQGYLSYALDAEAAARLWQVSEKLVGQKFV